MASSTMDPVAEKLDGSKMKVDIKMEVEDEPEPKAECVVKKEPVEEPENKSMELGAKVENVHTPAENEDDANKENETIKIEIIQKEEGLARFSIEGMEDDDDNDEEYVVMTQEEIFNYLQEKVMSYIKDPSTNKLLEYNKRCLDLQEEIKEKSEEYVKLNKLFDLIGRNQERFLRQVGVLPKIPTNTVEVSVDLPALTNSVPGRPQESLLKKDLTITKVPMTSPTIQTTDKTKKPTTKASTDDIECIDLTDEMEPPPKPAVKAPPVTKITMIKHPAPLPPKPYAPINKELPALPPKPRLKISAEDRGIVLQWDMPPSIPPNSVYAELTAFDIFGYQEQKSVPITTLLWKKIGSVKAMTLPMACTLTQFVEGNKYHFSIRAVDVHNRCGSYSDPISIVYKQTKSATNLR